MFKLKKIFNKHNNAPELEIQRMDYDSIDERDIIYCFHDGMLTSRRPENGDTALFYMACETVNPNDPFRLVKCYRITSDMLFEAHCSSALEPKCGQRFVLVADTQGNGFSRVETATDDQDSDGYYAEISNDWKNTKKVLVRLHCKQ